MKIVLLIVVFFPAAFGGCGNWGGWSSCTSGSRTRTRSCSGLANGVSECEKERQGCSSICTGSGCTHSNCGACPSQCQPRGNDSERCKGYCLYKNDDDDTDEICMGGKGDFEYQLCKDENEECQVTCGLRRTDNTCLKKDRIINGKDADCNEWPWQVALVYSDQNPMEPQCGGSLINSQYVITAAHCICERDSNIHRPKENTKVHLAQHKWKGPGSDQPAFLILNSEEFYTKDYNAANVQNDIAIIKLDKKVDNCLYTPICMPQLSLKLAQDLAGQKATVTGWGEMKDGSYPETLQELKDNVPIVTKEDCIAKSTYTDDFGNKGLHNGNILDGMFCAGGEGIGIDSCSGDSGGPLSHNFAGQRYQLLGAVSWGVGECADTFGIYADVPFYRDWILPIVGDVYTAP